MDFHENPVFLLKFITSFCIQDIYCNLTDAKQTHTVLAKHSESNQTLISEMYRHISNNFDDIKTCMKIWQPPFQMDEWGQFEFSTYSTLKKVTIYIWNPIHCKLFIALSDTRWDEYDPVNDFQATSFLVRTLKLYP